MEERRGDEPDASHLLRPALSDAGAAGHVLPDLHRGGDRGVVRAVRQGLGLSSEWRAPQWLTPEALAMLGGDDPWPPEAANHPWAKRYMDVFGTSPSGGISTETRFAYAHGLDRRDVFRDEGIVDFLLSIPPHLLHRPGTRRTKYLTRHAMNGRLPASILARARGGVLHEIVRDALSRHRSWFEAILWNPKRQWPQFVSEEWLRARWQDPHDRAAWFVAWRCVCVERWLATLERPC